MLPWTLYRPFPLFDLAAHPSTILEGMKERAVASGPV
jgi:hypothetical protein